MSKWSDGGRDFEVVLRDEPTTVDIKTSNRDPESLRVKEGAVNADYYVLGHLDGQMGPFYGGATRESIENGVRKESPFGHTNLTLCVKYLDPLPAPDEITAPTPT